MRIPCSTDSTSSKSDTRQSKGLQILIGCRWVGSTFLCALRNCAVHAILAGRFRSWNSDFAFWFRNRKVCEAQHAGKVQCPTSRRLQELEGEIIITWGGISWSLPQRLQSNAFFKHAIYTLCICELAHRAIDADELDATAGVNPQTRKLAGGRPAQPPCYQYPNRQGGEVTRPRRLMTCRQQM